MIFILLAVFLSACSAGEESPTPVVPQTGAGQPTPSPFEPQLTPVPTEPTTSPGLTTPGLTETPLPTEAPAVTETQVSTETLPSAGDDSAPVSLPDPSIYAWTPVVTGLDQPVGLFNAGDGSGRLFILEQPGRIRLVKEGQLLPDPFLDIRGRVGSGASEQGLLGLAFHPNFSENGQFFVNYTDLGGDTVIARYRLSAGDPDRGDPDSEERLLFVDQPYGNHNGGMLAFGPDSYLYIGLGDGGGAGDPLENAQNTNTMLGKLLRIDVDGGEPYGIPPDNPFVTSGGLPEIWAYGLRNPWRFSFDRQTGDLYIGDVGQGAFEEIDFLPAGSPGGANFGWDIMEGFECFNSPNCDPSGLTLPVYVYPTHVQGTCSVTGGYVYRGGSLPAFQGVYLLGDYCSGHVWGLAPEAGGAWQSAELFVTDARITSFGEDEAGEIYLVSHRGEVYQLTSK